MTRDVPLPVLGEHREGGARAAPSLDGAVSEERYDITYILHLVQKPIRDHKLSPFPHEKAAKAPPWGWQ